MKSALIAMSGGVDSSVAAYLMKRDGYDCTGITMKLFGGNTDEYDKSCCSIDDVEDARSVAYRLDIPFYVLNFTEDFERLVIDKFISEYQRGATPNPCIDCNRFIKFERLYNRAQQLNIDYVVTGHYACIEKDKISGRMLLKRAADTKKDQSYVLYFMTQAQLASTIFPLGNLNKTDVRAIAEDKKFINAGKRDSQDICFVPDGDYANFIERHTGMVCEKGCYIDTDGNFLGTHDGHIRYTIGQRKGLGVAFGTPRYVHSKNAIDNTVTLCEHEELYSKSLDVEKINLIACERMDSPMRLKVKIRYAQTGEWAMVESASSDRVHIEFDTPQRAVARGQAAVFYDGDIVVGGGVIV